MVAQVCGISWKLCQEELPIILIELSNRGVQGVIICLFLVSIEPILEEEAAKHKIRIKYHEKGAQWGRAGLEWRIVWIPTPARFASFFTGLNELGHIIVGHKGSDGKPEYLWEYEAFAWARRYCVEHGIPVPVRTVDYER